MFSFCIIFLWFQTKLISIRPIFFVFIWFNSLTIRQWFWIPVEYLLEDHHSFRWSLYWQQQKNPLVFYFLLAEITLKSNVFEFLLRKKCGKWWQLQQLNVNSIQCEWVLCVYFSSSSSLLCYLSNIVEVSKFWQFDLT